MNKKGFTLVELIIVIAIILLLGLIATPKVMNIINDNRIKGYKEIEKRLEEAAGKYIVENCIDSSLSSIIIEKNQLIEGKYIDEIYDLKDKSVCDAYVNVSNLNGIANFKTMLNCSNYISNIGIKLDVELNQGTSSQEFASEYNTGEIITLETPTKLGYSFIRWEVTRGNSKLDENVLTIGNTDTVISAIWEANEYVLTVEPNGGSLNQEFKEKYKSGEKINLIEPTREGYTFARWTVTDGNGYVSGNIFTMGTRDTTLTANWTINTYTITYNLDGGTNGSSAPTSGTYGSTVTISNPTKTGYTFDGWTVSGTNASMEDTNLTIGAGNITLTANWAINTYTITYNLDGGTNGSSAPTSGTYGETVTVSNPTKAGYKFTEWTVEGALMSGTKLTIGTSNVTLTANWELNSLIESYRCSNKTVGTEPYNFTYTGKCTVIDDGNDNWRVKFLTSGTFTPNQDVGIDAFLVGGGGIGGGNGSSTAWYGSGGGGGGYTLTARGLSLSTTSYDIIIGASASPTSAFGYTAAAGENGGDWGAGGAGGSGGGAGGPYAKGSGVSGGSDGGNGGNSWDVACDECGTTTIYGGSGQGTTTREFGESSGELYAGGGGGGKAHSSSGAGSGGSGGGGAGSYSGNGSPGKANTGGGGGGAANKEYYGGAGGSGIVVIRNTRSIVINNKTIGTYTGNYEAIDDGDNNWRVKFLTSGIFKPNQDVEIDAFLVGGGGNGGGSGGSTTWYGSGGGGGGYTLTARGLSLSTTSYDIIIGGSASPTSAFGHTAAAGENGDDWGTGGAGGSGGGAGGPYAWGSGAGGGSNGGTGGNSWDKACDECETTTIYGGSGQGTTTREFGESTGKLYAGGGGGGKAHSSGGAGSGGSGGGGAGGYSENGSPGKANTGGGGGGASNREYYGGAGGTGIVVIRNAR